MNFKESYILYKNGEQSGSPFSSKRSLDASIEISKRFEPDALLIVEVFVTTFDRSYIVDYEKTLPVGVE